MKIHALICLASFVVLATCSEDTSNEQIEQTQQVDQVKKLPEEDHQAKRSVGEAYPLSGEVYEPSAYAAPTAYAQSAAYVAPATYAQSAAYVAPATYAAPTAYATPAAYVAPTAYAAGPIQAVGSYAPTAYSGYGPSYGPEHLISQHVEINRAIPVPVYRTIAVPVQVPYPVPVIKTVAYPVEKPVPYPVDKPVPYPVDKPYPVTVEKKVPVPVDRPYPVYKIKHIYHEPKWSKWFSKW